MKARQFLRNDQYLFGLLGAVLDLFFAVLSIKYFDLNGLYVIIILAIPTGFFILLVGIRTAEESPHPNIRLPEISKMSVNIGRPQIKVGEDQHNCPVHGLEFCANAKSRDHVCMQNGGMWTEN